MSADHRQVGRTGAVWIVALALLLGSPACACSSLAPCLSAETRDLLHATVAAGASELASETRRQVAEALVAAQCERGVDALLLLAVAERESRFDPEARGPAGGIGLLQIRAATAEAMARRLDIPWRGERSLLDPAVNAQLGAAYLARLHRRFGTWEAALAAYNLGPTRFAERIARGHPPSSSYARAILNRHRDLAAELGP